jgi:hypothetical protein
MTRFGGANFKIKGTTHTQAPQNCAYDKNHYLSRL